MFIFSGNLHFLNILFHIEHGNLFHASEACYADCHFIMSLRNYSLNVYSLGKTSQTFTLNLPSFTLVKEMVDFIKSCFYSSVWDNVHISLHTETI